MRSFASIALYYSETYIKRTADTSLDPKLFPLIYPVQNEPVFKQKPTPKLSYFVIGNLYLAAVKSFRMHLLDYGIIVYRPKACITTFLCTVFGRLLLVRENDHRLGVINENVMRYWQYNKRGRIKRANN